MSTWTCTQSCKYCWFLCLTNGETSLLLLFSHPILSDSLRPHGLYTPRNCLGQNTGVGSVSLLQGIFLTPHILQESTWEFLFFISFQIAFGYLKGQCRYFRDVFWKTKPFWQTWSWSPGRHCCGKCHLSQKPDPKPFLWQKQSHKISQERELEKQTTPTTRISFLRRQS